ncbi:hypothetical protein [Actinophytocola xanthii]|uniref:Uncharacterized protein n=1 Tax=Actinophytocola xanthii TaxID=1912961 RepID=A0A1Q8CN39_9PSEU|nr:hypothetical protein [Actinophytocola xanthii]OLF15783.1 hypothetical protein BU204_20530 [Actinophytocola xanthii]
MGLRKIYADPAEIDGEIDDAGARRWTFGVAAGALLVAGTFAAGALGLSSATAPFLGEQAPEHATASPGPDRDEIGGAAVTAPPERDKTERKDTTRPDQADGSVSEVARNGSTVTSPADQGYQPPALGEGSGTVGGGNGGAGGGGGSGTGGGAGGQAEQPAPAPAPDPPATPEWEPQRGTLEKVVAPVTDTVGAVTDTVGDVVEPVTDTVGDVLSPVTGVLSGGDQPALTMINPLGDLLGR